MSNSPISIIRIAALTALVGGLVFAGPLNAAPAYPPDPLQDAMDPPPPPPAPGPNGHGHGAKMDHSPQAMAQRVEDRIRTLHDKLGVTNEQEAKWGDVAQAMRENEMSIDQLVQARHQNPASMTAVDDLQSYETITQAHADGLKKLIVAFQALYNDMPDGQRKNADRTFSRFEGHETSAAAKKHS